MTNRLKISKDTATTIIVFIFMVLFLYAAILKLVDYQTFRGEMGKSPIISNYNHILAWLVPSSEIIAAVLLFVPKSRLIGLYLSFTIMFGFTLYITMMMLFSPHLPCSCGGIISHMGWTGHLIFNISFTLMAVVASIFVTQRQRVENAQLSQNQI